VERIRGGLLSVAAYGVIGIGLAVSATCYSNVALSSFASLFVDMLISC